MKNCMIDVHAHFYPSSFSDKQIDQILVRAQTANVSSIVSVPETLEDAQCILALKNDPSIPDALRYMIEPCAGLHPAYEAKSLVKVEQVDSVLEFIKDKSFELVGVVGLDFTPHVLNNAISAHPELKLTTEGLKNIQREVFVRQIAVALQLDLPLNVHSRSAGHYVLDCLRNCGARKVVMHAFNGQLKYAIKGVEMGFYFSIPPEIVRMPQKQKLVAGLPLSNLLLESDSPVLGPEKGVDNEPNSIQVSAEEIARIKQIGVDEV
ncbi:7228_t:CDS:2, partial [Acaulospora morrowiae]